ncbi:MAG: serine hydrolase [Candidatus Omnitrophota bacterium]
MRKTAVISIVLFISLLLRGAFAFEQFVRPDKEELKKIILQFEQEAENGMHDWQIPGMAIALVRDNEIIFSKGFGVKTQGASDPVDERTIFQIGSTSKAFTAAMTAMLVDEGKLKWSDRVIDHYPDFQMYDSWVTREFMIEDLLAQHSGMPAYAGDFQAFVGFDRKHIINSLRYIKPVSSFRSEFAYVNNLFLVAGEIVEKYNKESWEESVSERIFKPLSMSDSSADMESLINGKNAATPHNIQGGKIVALPKDLKWTYIYAPAGGINSNVMDMSRWLMLHINNGKYNGKQLVSEESMDFMHSPKTIAKAAVKAGSAMYYCESWVYEDLWPYPMIWHNGGTSGFHTMLAFWPDAKIGIVVLTNLVPNQFAEALAKIFNDLYFGNPRVDWSKEALAKYKEGLEKEKEEMPKRPANVALPLPLEVYTGDFLNDAYETVKVTKKDDGLVVTIGPNNTQLILKHWDRDIFGFDFPLSGDDGKGFISFEEDADGRIMKMTIDLLNDDGLGVFERVLEKSQ